MSARRLPAQGSISVLDIARHRNGVCGAPFYVIRFEIDREPEAGTMVAAVFEAPGHVALLSVSKLAGGDIAFGSNSWRGDVFEPALRAHIAALEAEEARR